MLDLAGGTTVYLGCGTTDLRKSYNGLAAIIKLKFHLDPYSRCMFAFCNRRRTSIKILQRDGSGFWIYQRTAKRNNGMSGNGTNRHALQNRRANS